MNVARTIGIGCVFELPQQAGARSLGQKIFDEILPGEVDGKPVHEATKAHAKWAEMWEQRKIINVGYHLVKRLGGGSVIVAIDWANMYGGLKLAIPQDSQGTIRPVFSLYRDAVALTHPAHLARVEFFAERMVAVFDLLRPSFGWADSGGRLGFGKRTDPTTQPHWMTFLPPDREADLPRYLTPNSSVERRPWGGLVVRSWTGAFQPPEGLPKKRHDE